ncbi:TPA: hypothetical protein KPF84_001416 [Clostridioides difficile]|nr:hypothetical protein [Clostridioides difficile]MCR1445815.1 hypothetical protein [Clostridioides difficile]HBE9481639.1 hypothetical protein [Clostridioides difficile]HBG0962191.1 hypothetical protein [Clostridioides difficile]
MRLKFKSKDNSNRVEHQSIDSLAEFILNNKSFLGITLSILDEWKKDIDNSKIEDIIRHNSRFEESISKDKDYGEFIRLLNSFYNGTEKDISDRRGRILELIWDVVGTYSGKKFTQKIDEAIVLENEIEISDKDIDIVYVGEVKDKNTDNFIEMHECKSSANATLRTPLKPKYRGKLELMQSVLQISETEEIKCDGLIITFNANKRRLERKLKSYGFEHFKIIPRAEIEERVFNK